MYLPGLGSAPVTGMDEEPETLTGYHSPMHGRRPIVRRLPDEDAELGALTEQIRGWLNDGVEPHAIGVATRLRDLGTRVRAHPDAAGLRTGKPGARRAIQVGTMHAMKGLEFRCMAVVGASEELVPLAKIVADAEGDRAALEADLQLERCLLFVACTRARDRLYVSYSGAPSPFLPR